MSTATLETWRFWIDRGGTFTDVLAASPDGRVQALKLLSLNPQRYDDSAEEGVRQAMGLAPGAPIPGDRIAFVRLATTLATNALLERKGARTAFITTAGFTDALLIDDQTRPDIFALDIARPAPLAHTCVAIEERLDSEGAVVTALNEAAARDALTAAREAGCVSAAICLMHAWRNPAHEERLEALAREVGFTHVSRSSALDPVVKFIARARTTVADAYLTPMIQSYAQVLSRRLGGAPLAFMTSAGGLTDAAQARGRDMLLSGPAGGLVGMAKTAQRAGFRRVIGFDMGGTSTDVSRADSDRFERLEEARVGDQRVRAPMLAVQTVAAGGGSILRFEAGRARVGPDSAGADPGPASYGLGGPLTVTDANVLLGRLDPRFFPPVFGPQGDRPLNVAAVRKRFAKLAFAMGARTSEEAAAGFLDVAVEHMAAAVKRISLAQGVDAPSYALSSFGGAGGQVACRIADALGMTRVLVHPRASILSAVGIGLADQLAWREAMVEARLDGPGAQLARERAKAVESQARAALGETSGVTIAAEARLKYDGADTSLPVGLGTADAMRASFEAAHRRLFGFCEPDRAILIDRVAAEARAPASAPVSPDVLPRPGRGGPIPVQLTSMYWPGEAVWRECPVYRLEDMAEGAPAHGPALIVEPHSQIVVEPGWRAARRVDGMLVLERFAALHTGPEAEDGQVTHHDPNPVALELFNTRFMAVAEDMGTTLERTAHSVNIKERLDFSCAVFDAHGALVANAPHMPVHLGSMSDSVRAALARHPGLKPGEAVALNHPSAGGTHLPDITVVAPVHDPAGRERVFFVAARGHHADIGGVEPGSMPPFSTRLEEEGALFDAVMILKDGVFQDQAVRAALAAGPYPARTPDRNIADLKAQLAACARGAEGLQRLLSEYGRARVSAYMGYVQANAAEAVRTVLSRLPSGSARVTLDDRAVVAVTISVDQANRRAIVDFTDTAPARDTNFNAPRAIARAATLYVFRCLIGDTIPLNEGCLEPIELRIRPGTLLDPPAGAAVVAGNVETSQHVVDALLLATGASAASQGTMNNLTFGDATHQYYETICGGAGATPNAPGANGVHTHMTNSRLTDPEIIEARFAVRVAEHRLRAGSGGEGMHRGGDGTVRRLVFLAPMTCALLSSRRLNAPPGLSGGLPGLAGLQRLIRADGSVEELAGCVRIAVHPGDAIEIETPGGGGWGAL